MIAYRLRLLCIIGAVFDTTALVITNEIAFAFGALSFVVGAWALA